MVMQVSALIYLQTQNTCHIQPKHQILDTITAINPVLVTMVYLYRFIRNSVVTTGFQFQPTL